MLSGPATRSIIGRLRDHFGDSGDIIKGCSQTAFCDGPLLGVSQRKRKAFHAWEVFTEKNESTTGRWAKMSLDNFREEVSSIWGFGRWSADMIAIFHLGRLNVWPESDAGIKRACKVVFGTSDNSGILNSIQGCETAVALCLWEIINRNLVDDYLRELALG
jgi:DNA-3-methyladenine glycosylase II